MKSKEQLQVHRHDMSMYKSCARFGSGYKLLDHENALTYLKLRSEGCHRRNAKSFSTKIYCKVDATKETDGPVSKRILQVKKPGITTPNGWSYGGAHYDLGFKHCTNPNDFLHNDPQSKYFETHFTKHEEKIKEDYKSKIQALKQYFQEINSKCNFTKLSKQDLYAKLKQENKELRSGKKWMDLEIMTDPRTTQWIEDESILSAPISRLSTPRLTTTLQSPKPVGSLNKSIFSRRVSQETTAESVGIRPETMTDTGFFPKHAYRVKSELALPEEPYQESLSTDPPRRDSALNLLTKPLNLESLHDADDLRFSSHPLNNEDFAKFQKAYEDLENHAQELINMADNGPESYLESQLSRKNRTLSVNTQNIVDKNSHASPKAADQKNALAQEFNKINYFYYDKDSDTVVDPDSPTERKKKAAYLGKLRREKQEIETNIFKAIVQSQADKGEIEGTELNLKNLEFLKLKQLEIIQQIKRKTGLTNLGITSHSAAAANKTSMFHPSSVSSRKSAMKTPFSSDITIKQPEISQFPTIPRRQPIRKSHIAALSDRKSSISAQNTNRSSLSKDGTPHISSRGNL